MQKTHEMRMVRTAGSGLEEWACPTCGRRMLLRWPPHYVKHVLDDGDEQACHIARTPDDPPAGTTDSDSGTDSGTGSDSAATRRTGGGEAHLGARRWLRETGAAALARPSEPV